MSMPGVEASEGARRERLTAILRATPPLMRVLTVARGLCLADWLVFSGAVYQPVLNHLTGRTPDYGIKDYDLAYFDASDVSYEAEDAVIRRVKAAFDEPLRSMVEVRNQARVHLWFEAKFGEPYTPLSRSAEALERFASATFAVGVRLELDDRLHIEAPFGLADLSERGNRRARFHRICRHLLSDMFHPEIRQRVGQGGRWADLSAHTIRKEP